MQLAFAGLLGATGCGGAPDGVPCSTGPPVCLDSTEIELCVEGFWSAQSCEDQCGELDQVSVGCLHAQDGDQCVCESAPGSCSGSEPSHCVDADIESVCEDGSATFRYCWEVCAPTSAQIPVGCALDLETGIEACACVEIDDPCDEDATPHCTGPAELSKCVSGEWTLLDCAVGCEGASACLFEYYVNAGVCSCIEE